MSNIEDLFTARKNLAEICTIPDKIISVYSLEKHVWSDSNSEASRKARKPELQTIEEFQLDPVRPFLTDILRNIAAPWKKERRDNPVGQGYWIQAEFGSGKSHLLCCLAALALGRKEAWEIVKRKEETSGRGKRESLYRFWEEGIEAKSKEGTKGIFVIVKTLVGSGGGTVGLNDKGRRLSEYILDAAKEQMQIELGKNISLYPVELLADRFITEDMERYRKDLAKFLRDPKYFDEDEFIDVDEFIRTIQQNKTPEYKRSCGNKLWRFYTEYLKVQPQIAAETEDILKHMTETILAEGYSGILLVLDEVSLFMKNRDEDQRTDDEKTLVVLSNRLAKVHNLPIWTVCSAQQAIESKMGVKNIIADDRLKLVKLLEEDKDYYDIVLARVRKIKEPAAISNYYLHYKKGFTWPNSIGESDFRHFFPFHKPAIEVLRAITYELTTTRSAIHFMHQTLKHQIKQEGRELIRLWELFDEAVRYEEDPSGVHAGLVAIKTKRETDYRAYEACKRQIDGLTKGYLKVHHDKGVKVIQTLFLYHIARTRQQGITPEEIANSVLIERDADANPDENNQHYETIADNLRKELRQIVQTFDEEKRPRYRFDPVFTGVDPRDEFSKARDEAESNEAMQKDAWEHLLALKEWPIRTRQMTIDLSSGVRSIFRDIAPFFTSWEDRGERAGDQNLDIVWEGRQITGRVAMRDFGRIFSESQVLPPIESDQTDLDFSVYISSRPVAESTVEKLIERRKDPRVILWTPAELTQEERDRLIDFAAYRKLVSDWQGKETEDAVTVINWVSNALQSELAKIVKIVDNSYTRGRVDALNNTQMDFRVAGELAAILTPLVDRVLTAAYVSRDIKFDPPFIFRKEEGVKIINGIVKTGYIPKGAKPNQNISAAQNFGFGLNIMKKSAEKELDISDNTYAQDMWSFIDDKLADDGQSMKADTIYKNFMGIGGPKDYGLTRRMVQIYILCLVRKGRVRLTVSSKAGLATSTIDYSNLADVDFSTKVLDSLVEIQKVAKPENWEVLRPYAEKLLGTEITATQDDAEISKYRARLQQLFKQEKDTSSRTLIRAQSLFDTLKTKNPYEVELGQVAKLFSSNVEGGDDIHLILYALKEAMGYQAFDANAADTSEVDDLANRLKNYRDIRGFLEYETDIRAANAYCSVATGNFEQLGNARQLIDTIRNKMTRLKDYIDSDVKLKTELVGHFPPLEGETDTIAAMIREYSSVYLPMHESVIDKLDTARKNIQDTITGTNISALEILDGITALQPSSTTQLKAYLTQLGNQLFMCQTSSRASIEDQLRNNPIHECGLSFTNAVTYVQEAEKAEARVKQLLDETFERKMEVFFNAAVRERLEQGKGEPCIAQLLGCKNTGELRVYMIKAALENPDFINIINKFLKRIIVKRVKIADFKPESGTIQKNQVGKVTAEFSKFLETRFDESEKDGDSITMLQFE
ncbi:MAG: hypothetical protein LLF82_000114 [Dehalococcoides mccartyi]|uniref:hypothetical protein n=1 Tax=Dehalococcoides mccartyi TaxID=61435 RepID=UPI00243275EA|nr:hypothetical protein [Dehalococcoides mccartyi]MCF7634650.1 hypothetical protein [Dehalococcoides mccartyi]